MEFLGMKVVTAKWCKDDEVHLVRPRAFPADKDVLATIKLGTSEPQNVPPSDVPPQTRGQSGEKSE